jgi:DNA-binding LytR/AlgR family response regulator
MSKFKIIVVEDEALIADNIADILESCGYEIPAVCGKAEAALMEIEVKKPDLVLLDINLNGNLDGIDLAHEINKRFKIPFIFLTSNSDGKTIDRAKLTSPAGFIVKPFNKADLQSSIEIAIYKKNQKQLESETTNTNAKSSTFFFVKEKQSFIKVEYTNILYAEACDNYTIIYTKTGKHIVSQTLKVIEDRLVEYGFFRVHRTYLVNLNSIDRIDVKSLIINSKEIPISEANKADLLKKVSTL